MKESGNKDPERKHPPKDDAHPDIDKKNKQGQNESSTSQEKEFDVSTEDLNRNELQGHSENQPNINAEKENERFNEQLNSGGKDTDEAPTSEK